MNENSFEPLCNDCGNPIRIGMKFESYPVDPRIAHLLDPETPVSAAFCGHCGSLLSFSVLRHDPKPWHLGQKLLALNW